MNRGKARSGPATEMVTSVLSDVSYSSTRPNSAGAHGASEHFHAADNGDLARTLGRKFTTGSLSGDEGRTLSDGNTTSVPQVLSVV